MQRTNVRSAEGPAGGRSGDVGTGSAPSRTIRHSLLATLLLREVLWGTLSCNKAQRIALASAKDTAVAMKDGAIHEDITVLSKLGTKGFHRGHVWRDLKRKLRRSNIKCTPVAVPLKAYNGRDEASITGTVGIVYPHEVFHTLHTHHPEKFKETMLGGDESNVPAYWDKMTRHPSYASHPMHKHRWPFKEKAVPIRIHGDETPATAIGKSWVKMIDATSWSSCLIASGATHLNNFIMVMIYSMMVLDTDGGFQTETVIWTHLTWSLYWLFQGVWPDRGPDGALYTSGQEFLRSLTPLAGGFYAPLWAILCDRDHGFKKWRFADYNSGTPCTLCRADNRENPWTDLRDGVARWTKTLWSNESYAAHHPKRHMLIKFVPGVGITNHIPDVMHDKNLGTDKSFVASSIRALTHHILPLDSDKNLAVVWAAVVKEYKRRRTPQRFSKITKNMVQGQKKLPDMKGKAAQIKHIVPVLASVFAKFMDRSNPQHRDILCGLESSARIDSLLSRHKNEPVLPEPAVEALRKACWDFCLCQAALVQHYHPHTALFNNTIKGHGLLHIALCAEFVNPAIGACWSGEDMMLVVRRLAASSAHGCQPSKAQYAAMEKYALALDFELGLEKTWW